MKTLRFDYLSRDWVSRAVVAALFVGGFFIPICVIIILNCRMVELMRQTNNNLRNTLNIQMVICRPTIKVDANSGDVNKKIETKPISQSRKYKSKNELGPRRRCALSAIMSGQLRVNILLQERESKLIKKVAWCVGLFSLSWFPYAIVVLVAQFYPENNFISPLVSTLPSVCAKTSVIFNPLLYTLISPEFKVFFKETFGLKK